ncbi:hypothetical protein [Microcoleus sp.]|uniref:hypothetical protein n=1 Tax=Microcoleus sp. TaxID=44472 RepID=UPI00403E9B43
MFFSSDRGEPAHISVKRDWQLAKFWLNPVSLKKIEASKRMNYPKYAFNTPFIFLVS